MTSYSDLLAQGAALPPSPDNALGTWGGTSTRPLADKLSEWVNVKDFGVIEEEGVDNAAALVALRTHLRLNKTRLHNVIFNGGHVQYTDNKWLRNIGPIRIIGNGTRLECISSSSTWRLSRVFDNSTWFTSEGDSATGGTSRTGYRFTSADRTTRLIPFVTAGDAALFAVGEKVVVTGFDNQFTGFPPNPKYFEWATVGVVDTEANTITLREPLRNSYDADWPDLSGSAIGAPRIWKTSFGPAGATSGYFYNPYIEINDIETIDSGLAAGNPNGHTLSADTMIWNNCKLDGDVWPSMNRYYAANNCEIVGRMEVDKICDYVYCHNVHLREKVGGAWGAGSNQFLFGSGINFMHIDGGSAAKVDLRSRVILIENMEIASAGLTNFGVILTNQGWTTRSITIRNNRITAHAALNHVVNNIPAEAITAGFESVDKNIILADGTTAKAIVRQLDVGSRVYRTSPVESALVSRIGWDDANSRWIIYFSDNPFSTTIAAGETFNYYQTQKIIYQGNVKLGRTNLPAIRYNRPDQVITDDATYG